MSIRTIPTAITSTATNTSRGPRPVQEVGRVGSAVGALGELAGDIVQGPELGAAMDELRTFMFDRVYLGEQVRTEHERIERVIGTLFDHYAQDPERLPDGGGALGADVAQRVIDYLAGMTDRYCIRVFEALTVPESFAA